MLGRDQARLVAVLVGLMTTLVVLTELFVPRTIGATDNGDGIRLTCQLHIADQQPRVALASTQRFVTVGYLPAHGSTACTDYHSSALLLLRAGISLTRALGSRYALDLRTVGVLCALLVGALVGWLVLLLPGSWLGRLLVGAGIALVVTDVAVVQFFVSVYSEPAALLGILAVVAGLLALWRRAPGRLVPLLTVTAALAWFAAAKTETAPLAVVVALAVVVGSWFGSEGRRRSRVLTAAAMSLVLALAGFMVASDPKQFRPMHLYADVFDGILRHSPNPAADLTALGEPPRLARYAVTTYFERGSARQDPAYRQFTRTMTFGRVARFYAQRPERLLPLAAEAAQAVVRTRDPVPNTVLGTAPRPQLVCRVCLLSTAAAAIAPAGAALVPVVWIGALGCGFALLRRDEVAREWRALGGVLVVLPGLAATALLTGILGDGGMELVKHMFPAAVATWLLVPLTALAAAGLLRRTVTTSP